jgi:uncharacterized membrane protein HdeD (DUF308 family)
MITRRRRNRGSFGRETPKSRVDCVPEAVKPWRLFLSSTVINKGDTLMTTAPAAAEQGGSNPLFRDNWGWTLARGVLASILGVLAIVFPASALFAFNLVFAAFLFVDGIFSVVSGLRGATHQKDRWWAYVLRGIAGLIVGTLFVLMPFVMTLGYAFATLVLLAAWSIAAGVLEIVAAIRLRKEIKGEWLLALSGALSILLGIGVMILFALFPAASILSVAWMIGVYAIAAGVVLIVQAFRMRKPADPPAAPATSQTASQTVTEGA